MKSRDGGQLSSSPSFGLDNSPYPAFFAQWNDVRTVCPLEDMLGRPEVVHEDYASPPMQKSQVSGPREYA
jgi:hypothetical protein